MAVNSAGPNVRRPVSASGVVYGARRAGSAVSVAPVVVMSVISLRLWSDVKSVVAVAGVGSASEIVSA